MPAKPIAFLGTGSDVGKSVITAGFCRILANRGYSVAPFKAQNMSNNSWVTVEGGEIGRAQVVQAQAAYIEPHVDMNPILLKPASAHGVQIVVQGAVWKDVLSKRYQEEATEYCARKAFESLDRLKQQYDYICIEGAGSCAELNIMSRDFVNFRTAQQANSPVILVADIDTGGVFAKVCGTLSLLPKKDRDLVKGIIINKFHGDISFFRTGKDMLEEKTAIPVIGVIPFLEDIAIDAEDSVPLANLIDPDGPPAGEKISIAVIAVPCISNWTDFHALMRIPQVDLHYLLRPRDLQLYDCVILPGSKGVLSDLAWLRRVGWERKIGQYTGKIFGMCGGYQMLGKTIADPHGTEGPPDEAAGFGYLDIETIFSTEKRLTRVTGHCDFFNCSISGYEIHMGRTVIHEKRLFLQACAVSGGKSCGEGCVSPDGRVIGTYVHGIADHHDFIKGFLTWVQREKVSQIPIDVLLVDSSEDELNKFAEHIEKSADVEKVLSIIDDGLRKR